MTTRTPSNHHNPDEDGWCQNSGCDWNVWNAKSSPACPVDFGDKKAGTIQEQDDMLLELLERGRILNYLKTTLAQHKRANDYGHVVLDLTKSLPIIADFILSRKATPAPTEGVEPVSEVDAYSDPSNPIDKIDHILADFIDDHSRAFYDPKSTPKTAIKIRSAAKAAIERLIAEARVDESRNYFGTPNWQWEDSPKRMSVTRGEIYARVAQLNQMKGKTDV